MMTFEENMGLVAILVINFADSFGRFVQKLNSEISIDL